MRLLSWARCSSMYGSDRVRSSRSLLTIVDRLPQGQHHLAQPLVFGLSRDQILLDAGQARKLLANLSDAATEGLPIAEPRPLGFAFDVQSGLGLLVEHHDHFVLELLQRLLDLRETAKLGLRARQAALPGPGCAVPAPASRWPCFAGADRAWRAPRGRGGVLRPARTPSGSVVSGPCVHPPRINRPAPRINRSVRRWCSSSGTRPVRRCWWCGRQSVPGCEPPT